MPEEYTQYLSRCGKTPFVAMPIIGELFDHGKTIIWMIKSRHMHLIQAGQGAVLLQECDGENSVVLDN